jgi:hypothetical protein
MKRLNKALDEAAVVIRTAHAGANSGALPEELVQQALNRATTEVAGATARLVRAGRKQQAIATLTTAREAHR